MPDTLIPKAKKCGNCPPLVAPRRAYTPSRPSCIECVEKHLGAAYVLLTEAREGYAYRLRAVGHLFEAEDEAQEWPELHAAIRDARTHYQAGEQMPDWQELEDGVTSTRRRRTDVPDTARNPSGKE